MAQKFIISKPGFNVLTETDPDNLIFSSDYGSLMYYASGAVVVTPAGTSAEAVVAHGLGYIPYFLAYIDRFAGPPLSDFNMCPGKFASGAGFVDADAYADAANLYFTIHTDFNTSAFTFRYFIFRNKLNF